MQNGPARSQIIIRDAEVKRAEIGRIRRTRVNLGCFPVAARSPLLNSVALPGERSEVQALCTLTLLLFSELYGGTLTEMIHQHQI